MNPADLITLVEKMRAAQKEYFRTRSDSSLQESKRLEKQVDQWLHDYRDSAQGKLFNDIS